MSEFISVIVLNWNGKEYLPLCLDSLKKQTFGNFEIYLVDNGSTDGSVDFVKKNYPQVKIIALRENLGFSGGINAGIKNSKGDFIALLNNDACASPKWLEELFNGINQRENAGICASKMLFYHNPDVINAAGDIYRIDGVPDNRGRGEKDSGQYDAPCFVFSACAGAALYRRSMFNDAGFFDEDFFAYMEDMDLSFRAQLLGYKCLYVPTAVVRHIHMATSGKNPALQLKNYMRNKAFTIIKIMPAGLIFKYSFWIFFTCFTEFVSIVLNPGKNIELKKAYLNSWVEIISRIPACLKKRKQIQKNKKVSNKYISSVLTPVNFGNYVNIINNFLKKKAG